MIARPFLITGLPRSRTAWMSAVANTIPGAICYHEPIEQFPSWQISLSLWNEPRYSWVGISDSAMGFHLAEIINEYRPRILIIERNIDDAEVSLRRLGIPATNYCSLLRDHLSRFIAHRLVRTVAFDRLADTETVRACLQHLMPGAVIDGSKISALQRLNIQADVEMVKESAEARKHDISAVLGAEIAAALRVA